MTDLFHGADPNPPFEPADLQAALQASKARAWRRRSMSIIPAALLAGVGSIFAVSFISGPVGPPNVTTFESADVVLPVNDGLIDIDGPVEVEPPSGPDAEASSAGRVTALQIDTDKVTVIVDKPISLIDVEPESDVTPVTPPADATEETDSLETDSADTAVDVTSETSSATPLETATELSNETAADTAASSSDEPTDEPTSAPAESQGSEGASAPGSNGVALSTADGSTDNADASAVEPTVPSDAGEGSPSNDVSAGDISGGDVSDSDASGEAPAGVQGSVASSEEAVASGDEANVDPGDESAAVDSAPAIPTNGPTDASTPTGAAVDDTAAAGTAEDDVVAEAVSPGTDSDPVVAAAADETDPDVELAEALIAENMPVSVEFASMVIDGSSVEIVLQVNDVDGWTLGACGTSMNWGDGSSSGSLCAPECAVAEDGTAAGPGVSGEIRFSHTYEATEGVVTPLFTIFTGYECFGDAFYGELNPSLVLSPDGIVFAS